MRVLAAALVGAALASTAHAPPSPAGLAPPAGHEPRHLNRSLPLPLAEQEQRRRGLQAAAAPAAAGMSVPLPGPLAGPGRVLVVSLGRGRVAPRWKTTLPGLSCRLLGGAW